MRSCLSPLLSSPWVLLALASVSPLRHQVSLCPSSLPPGLPKDLYLCPGGSRVGGLPGLRFCLRCVCVHVCLSRVSVAESFSLSLSLSLSPYLSISHSHSHCLSLPCPPRHLWGPLSLGLCVPPKPRLSPGFLPSCLCPSLPYPPPRPFMDTPPQSPGPPPAWPGSRRRKYLS